MFNEKVYWITGASSGIGEALVLALAKRGAHLIISGRNVDALKEVAERAGDCLILPFDSADTQSVSKYVQQAVAWKARIDGLINNAGISQRSLAVETEFPVYEKIIGIDLLAPIALTQAVLPYMAKARTGRIVMITSVAGRVGSPLRTGYSAAKFGLHGYGEALRCEVKGLGIEVHTVAPGSVRTNVSRNAILSDGSSRGKSDEAIEKGMEPARFAETMLRAMERGERDIIIARGVERKMTQMRRRSPNKLFDMMAEIVSKGYADRMKRDQ